MQNAFKGGDVKYSIYLYKLLFEAIARSKKHHTLKTDEIFSEQIDKMQILMLNVIENFTKQNFDELMENFHNLKEMSQTFLKS